MIQNLAGAENCLSSFIFNRKELIECMTKDFLRRVVIKEELVALTGSWRKALILNQLIYWTKINREVDKVIEEENRIIDSTIPKIEGWIYKKAGELIEELMLDCTDDTIRSDLKSLITKGWVDERRNPKVAYDRTLQYRVNLTRIQKDLNELGFSLVEYPVVNSVCNPNDSGSKTNDSVSNTSLKGNNTKDYNKDYNKDIYKKKNTSKGTSLEKASPSGSKVSSLSVVPIRIRKLDTQYPLEGFNWMYRCECGEEYDGWTEVCPKCKGLVNMREAK